MVKRKASSTKKRMVKRRRTTRATGTRVKPELKYYETGPASQNVSTTGVISPIFVPVLGTDAINRVGRQTTMKSVQIRGFFLLEGSATPATGIVAESQAYRVLLVWDKQPTPATAVTITDILNSATAQAQTNLSNRDRFRILRDHTGVFDAMVYNTTATQAVAAWGKTVQNFEYYTKFSGKTTFNATNGGTIADISSGALYLCFIGTVAAGTDTDTNVYYTTRVRFTDD